MCIRDRQATDYDILGRLVKERDRLDAELGDHYIERIYDEAGNMIGLTDQEGNETSYSYDLMNRKTETIFEDGKQSLIAYDSIGRMLSVETFTRNAPMTVANVRTSKT